MGSKHPGILERLSRAKSAKSRKKSNTSVSAQSTSSQTRQIRSQGRCFRDCKGNLGNLYDRSTAYHSLDGGESWIVHENGDFDFHFWTYVDPDSVAPEPTIDAILTFFDESVADGSLTGDGQGNSANGRSKALRNMLEMAGDLIGIGDIKGACKQLKSALGKCDGLSPPPDFVTGSEVSTLIYGRVYQVFLLFFQMVRD